MFGDVPKIQFSRGKMEVHVRLKNAFPGGKNGWFASHSFVSGFGNLQITKPVQRFLLSSFIALRFTQTRLTLITRLRTNKIHITIMKKK